MEMILRPGIKGKEEIIVNMNDSASYYGSGLVDVFATPAMIALMEKTAMKSVLPYLPEGYNTVGTEVNIKHIKATPMKSKVTCESELISVEDKKLIFKVFANDEQAEIGNGTHTRFIINTQKFMERLEK